MPKADILQKKLIIADWPKYLRDSFTQRGGSPNGRALTLHARGKEIKAPHLHSLRTCVILFAFWRKTIAYWNFLPKADFPRKNHIVADWVRDLRDSYEQRGCRPNCRALASPAIVTGINVSHLQRFRNYFSLSAEKLFHLKLHAKSRHVA